LLGVGVDYELPTTYSTTWTGGKPVDRNRAYACFRDLREATTDGAFNIDWRFDDPQIAARLRTTMLGQPGSRIVLARTPQVRPAGHASAADETKLDDYWRPSVCVRREGDAPLASTFVAVQQPYVDQPFISGIESLRHDEDVIAVRVTHAAGVDTIISQRGDNVTIDDITTDAPLAVVRRTNDGVAFAWMIGGTTLRCDSAALQSPGPWRGDIIAAERDPQNEQYRLITTAAPPPIGIADTPILVTHGDGTVHAYTIRSVSRDADRTIINLRNDHGFTIDGDTTQFVSYPQRSVEGGNTFEVLPVVMRE
jgi:hypothetical protein